MALCGASSDATRCWVEIVMESDVAGHNFAKRSKQNREDYAKMMGFKQTPVVNVKRTNDSLLSSVDAALKSPPKRARTETLWSPKKPCACFNNFWNFRRHRPPSEANLTVTVFFNATHYKRCYSTPPSCLESTLI
eukprot:TRINITY_DN1875_c0_g1_i1.p1 TRINITY_DN1875_c0_g1~~TRINITY_DN1875_c0_g1_i1.p1  ORF type:complete len:135 (+),score=3.38 TRINITY_DN1875_c0_g1_i1:347-751(+)